MGLVRKFFRVFIGWLGFLGRRLVYSLRVEKYEWYFFLGFLFIRRVFLNKEFFGSDLNLFVGLYYFLFLRIYYY